MNEKGKRVVVLDKDGELTQIKTKEIESFMKDEEVYETRKYKYKKKT